MGRVSISKPVEDESQKLNVRANLINFTEDNYMKNGHSTLRKTSKSSQLWTKLKLFCIYCFLVLVLQEEDVVSVSCWFVSQINKSRV